MVTVTRAPARHHTLALRAAIWSMLAVLLALGSFALAALNPAAAAPDQTEHLPAEASDGPAGPAQFDVLAQGASEPLTPLPSSDMQTRYLLQNANHDDYVGPEELLPAQRWSSATRLFTNYRSSWSATDAFGSLASAAASFLFTMSSWVWGLLVALLTFALTLNVAGTAGDLINDGFTGMANSIVASGVFGLLVAMALLLVVKSILTVRLGQALRIVAMTLIPIAALSAIAAATEPGAGARATMSPAWIAETGVGFVDELGVAIGGGFGLASFDQSASRIEALPDNDGCQEYVANLYAYYDSASADRYDELDRSMLARAGIDTTPRSNASRQLVANTSSLWQSSFYQQWVEAQYGLPEYGHHVACHQLESQARISPSEQKNIADASGIDLPVAAFRSHPGDNEAQMGAYMAFLACDHTSGDVTPLFEGTKFINLDTGCSTWASDGDPHPGLQNPRMDDVADVSLNEPGASFPEETFLVYESMAGHNLTPRLFGGLVSLITAALYFWALGAIALGSIIGQFGLVMMLMALPITLTLLAMPSAKGQRNPAGVKMLKITGAFFAAKLVLVAMMTMLMQMILAMNSLVPNNGRGLSNIITMLIPLIALFLLRYLVKKIGFGNITNLGGALGLTALATKSGGEGNLKLDASSVGRNSMNSRKLGGMLDKTGLGAADALVKRQGARALAKSQSVGKNLAMNTGSRLLNTAKAGSEGALALATALPGAIGARGKGLGTRIAASRELNRARKDALLGTKDADGNTITEGSLKRYGSFSGLAVAAQHASGKGTGAVRAAGRAAAKLSRPDKVTHAEAQQNAARFAKQQRKELAANRDLSREDVALGLADKVADNSYQRGNEEFKTLMKGEELRPGDTEQHAEFISEAKKKLNVSRGALLASQNGLGARVAPTGAAGRVQGGKSDEATLQQAAKGYHWLPKELKERQQDETVDEYMLRLDMLSQAGGGIDIETGAEVDWLEAKGVNVQTEAGRQLVLDIAAGEVEAPAHMQMALSREQIDKVNLAMEEHRMRSTYKDGGRAETHRIELQARTRERQSALKDGREKLQARQLEVQATVRQLNEAGRAADKAPDEAVAQALARAQVDKLRDQLKGQMSELQEVYVGTRESVAQIEVDAVLLNPDSTAAERSKAPREAKVELDNMRTSVSLEIENMLRAVDSVDTSVDGGSKALAEVAAKITKYSRESVKEVDGLAKRSTVSFNAADKIAEKDGKDRRTSAAHAESLRKKRPARVLMESRRNAGLPR